MTGRGGSSLSELLVALTLLALGGSMSARLLLHATRDMEGAELGLRAAIYLSELSEGGAPGEDRPAGPGRLVASGSGSGARVEFVAPSETPSPTGLSGGFRRSRGWALDDEFSIW